MKWRGYWWGIELVSENKKDKSFLKQLIEKLPKKAESSECWPLSKLETAKKPSSENFAREDIKDNKGGFTIILRR